LIAAHHIQSNIRHTGVRLHYGADEAVQHEQQHGSVWEANGQRRRHQRELAIEYEKKKGAEAVKHLSD
jgi:hypothetical protein